MSIRSLSVPLLSKYLPPMKFVLTACLTRPPPRHCIIIHPFLCLKTLKQNLELNICTFSAVHYWCLCWIHWHLVRAGCAGINKREACFNQCFPAGKKRRKDHARSEKQQGHNSASLRNWQQWKNVWGCCKRYCSGQGGSGFFHFLAQHNHSIKLIIRPSMPQMTREAFETWLNKCFQHAVNSQHTRTPLSIREIIR